MSGSEEKEGKTDLSTISTIAPFTGGGKRKARPHLHFIGQDQKLCRAYPHFFLTYPHLDFSLWINKNENNRKPSGAFHGIKSLPLFSSYHIEEKNTNK